MLAYSLSIACSNFGSLVKGFLCEPYALQGAANITHFGGWRAYRSSLA
jgi:allophanate hydrolase